MSAAQITTPRTFAANLWLGLIWRMEPLIEKFCPCPRPRLMESCSSSETKGFLSKVHKSSMIEFATLCMILLAPFFSYSNYVFLLTIATKGSKEKGLQVRNQTVINFSNLGGLSNSKRLLRTIYLIHIERNQQKIGVSYLNKSTRALIFTVPLQHT